jgi:hypothetical protein
MSPMQLQLLLPAQKRLERSSILEYWSSHGDGVRASMAGRDVALRETFHFHADTLPAGALTRSVDATDAAGALWLRADPAFVMADAVTLRLLACGNLSVSGEEAAAFAQALQPLFAEMGFEFDASHAQRWYLRCAMDAKLPTFSPPEDALGDDLARHLPEGENARRWRSLLNEVQIVLTQHPANARRAQRGLPPVNSLWFWGAGIMPDSVRCEFAQVYSDDEIVAALAASARVAKFASPADVRELFSASSASASTSENAKVLIDLAHCRDSAQLESDWFAPIDAALKQRRIDRLDLRFESGEHIVFKPAHRWRFWRRAKPQA